MLCVKTTVDGYLKVSSAIPCDGALMLSVTDAQGSLDETSVTLLITAALGLYALVYIGKFVLHAMGFR
ncbi:TPA: hypothetical protein ACX6Q9_003565 [Photobacterium damselae]